jgi:hypothetical protein
MRSLTRAAAFSARLVVEAQRTRAEERDSHRLSTTGSDRQSAMPDRAAPAISSMLHMRSER